MMTNMKMPKRKVHTILGDLIGAWGMCGWGEGVGFVKKLGRVGFVKKWVFLSHQNICH